MLIKFIIKRLIVLCPILVLISIVSYAVIELPPGNHVQTLIDAYERDGIHVEEDTIKMWKAKYGLDKNLFLQYLFWIKPIVLDFDFGNSFHYQKPVTEILSERIPRTIGISILAIAVQWLIGIPIGIYSAIKKNSIQDYIFSFFGFIGLAIPPFMLAIVLVYYIFVTTGWAMTGLYSPEFVNLPWSFSKFLDLMKNISLPIIILSVSGVAILVRIMRAALLDELQKNYVVTARSKGLSEYVLLLKYPVRVALNPLISTIGWVLPATVGGEIIVSKVLNLDTTGPILLEAILNEDMFLAGGIIFLLSVLTVIGTLLSDILLAMMDPRIRYE